MKHTDDSFAEWIANDDELADLSASDDAIEALAANVPVQLEEFGQLQDLHGDAESRRSSPTDASELAKITVPVLLLHGSETALRTWFTDGVHHVAEHVADPQVREIAGAGHFGVALAPEPIADELTRFLRSPTP